MVFVTNSPDLEALAKTVVTFDIADAKHISMSKADTNNDGFVSLDEYKAAGGQAQHFAKFDLDGDGKLDSHEQCMAELVTSKESPEDDEKAGSIIREKEIQLELNRLSTSPLRLASDNIQSEDTPPQMQVESVQELDDEAKRYLEEVDVIVGH